MGFWKWVAAVVAITLATAARAADKSEPIGDPVAEAPTLRCLGAYWIIKGDDNANAYVSCAYRKVGETKWKSAAEFLRVEKGRNKDKNIKVPEGAWLFAGSVIDLPEATEYELRVMLTDKDGGGADKIIRAKTIAEPKLAENAPTFHVVPGAGGGSGTKADPYKGIAEAEKHAKPGDLFLIHAGTYDGLWEIKKSGEDGKPIVWRGAGDGETILQFDIPIGNQGYPPGHIIELDKKENIWFENLTIRGQAYSDICIKDSHHIVVRRCKLEPFLYGVVATRNNTGKLGSLFISDNTIRGKQPFPATNKQWNEIAENRGIWVGGAGNVICYNKIDHCKDGIDTAEDAGSIAIDVHNNEVSQCYDDGAEMDGSLRNCRNFDNRYVDSLTGISFQPVHGGPVYAYRNVVYNARSEFLKLHNSPSGVVVVHNTFVHFGPLLHISTSEEASNIYMRNNLFVGTEGMAANFDLPLKNVSIDYDGFVGFSSTVPFLKFNGEKYGPSRPARTKWPIEDTSCRIEKPEVLFASGIKPPERGADYNENADGYSWTTGLKVHASEKIDLRLDPKAKVAGRGTPLPGFNDSEHLDLGAYQLGAKIPQYGPRPEK